MARLVKPKDEGDTYRRAIYAAPPAPQGLETGNVDSWIFRYARENAPSDAVGVDIYSAQGTLIGSLDLKEKVEIPAPDTRHAEAQEPKAQDNPTWMDDCINVCSRHSLQFTKHPDECFVCTNRAPHTPTVTALVEAAEKAQNEWLKLYESHCLGRHAVRQFCPVGVDGRSIYAAVKKERS